MGFLIFALDPKLLIVVVPLIITELVLAELRSVVVALATVVLGPVIDSGAPVAFVYEIICQFPLPRYWTTAVSFAAVSMFAAPGKIIEVAL